MARYKKRRDEEWDIYEEDDLEFIDDEEDGLSSDEVGFMRGYIED